MSMLRFLRPGYIPTFLRGKDDLQIQREIVLQSILNSLMLFSLVAFLYWGISVSWRIGAQTLTLILAGLASLAIITLIRRLPFLFRSLVVISTLASIGVIDFLHNGLSGNGAIFFLTICGIAAAFYGMKVGIATIVLAGLSEGLIGWLMITHRVKFPTFAAMVTSGEPFQWLYSIFTLLLCAILITTGVFQFSWGLSRTLRDLRGVTRSLEQERSELEKRVAIRTEEISHKAAQLEAARQVAARISAQSDIESLLETAAGVVREQFGLYYTAIFLADEANEYAVLRAGTGDAGKVMLQRHHRLKIGEVGIVGHVMSKGEPRIAGNVDEDPAHYKNPDLPDTRSEMGVPLKIGNRVIGVLDVQSDRRNAFSSDDVDVLQTIADQLAAALDKAQILEQYQDNLRTLQRQAQQFTRDAWLQHLRNANRPFAYRFRQDKIETIAPDRELATETIDQLHPTSMNVEGGQTVLTLPIRLRGQIIGLVKLRLATPHLNQEMTRLLENAIERMALSLDNVRLLEEVQTRAERERLVGDISSKVRSATDVDSILQITANELGRSLGVSEVIVQLNPAA